jgi:hypothetical protein
MTRRELTRFWDAQLARWLRGEPLAPALDVWKLAYRAQVDEWAFPEPFIGDMLGSPRVVLLANNPGVAKPDLQARDGVFARQIAEIGFTRWASTRPFDGPNSEWVKRGHGEIHHTLHRLKFARRLLRDGSLDFNDMLTVELFPWHSPSLKARIQVPPHILREFIIEPLSELGSTVPVLALAKGWADALDRAPAVVEHVKQVDGFKVPSRQARLYSMRGGGRILVVWHSGSDKPPNEHDTERLRTAWFGGQGAQLG